MNEQAVWFGATRSLSGIVTEPTVATGLPAALLLNAGYLHRVGPHRLYVTLARRLAALGFPVLRFDQSGLGESAPREDGVPLNETVLSEGIEAMDFLAASGIADRFIPMGLCWGGENAQKLASADARVVGAALIDGFAYRTAGYYLREGGKRLLSVRSWPRMLATSYGMLARRFTRGAADDAGAPFLRNPGGVDFVREFPSKPEYLEQVRGLVGREVELLLVFTAGGMAEYYNHRRQFGEAFPALRRHPRIQLEFMSKADHTLTLRSEQDALMRHVTGWLEARFLGAARAAEPAGVTAAAS
jgi:pimeloyl-ACP methyl ester carboxylesterase